MPLFAKAFAKRNNKQAAKCVLDFNKNDSADNLDFDMNLKTNPIGMIQIKNQKWLDFFKIEHKLENRLAKNKIKI